MAYIQNSFYFERMRNLIKSLQICVLFVGFLGCASSEVNEERSSEDLLFAYHDLAVKNLDEMSELVQSQIKKSRTAEQERMPPLLQGLMAVYARPDGDGMIDKVVGSLRSEIEDIDTWPSSMNLMTDKAITALQNSGKVSAVDQVSYTIILTNVLAQLKPASKRDGFEKEIVIKIRDANIELSKKMRDERRLRMMKNTVSPSEIAARILKGDSNTSDEIKD
jgi:hypothetical protein